MFIHVLCLYSVGIEVCLTSTPPTEQHSQAPGLVSIIAFESGCFVIINPQTAHSDFFFNTNSYTLVSRKTKEVVFN